MRKTKIVATVGPSCQKPSTLKALIQEGADVLRINASHTTLKGLREWMQAIRQAEKQVRKPVAILVDLQGPRVRTGFLRNHQPLKLNKGDKVEIEMSHSPGTQDHLTTLCPEFTKMVKAGNNILIDNGQMELKALKVTRRSVYCDVLRGGILGENKGINLPHAPITLPALSTQDYHNLTVAIEEGADYIGLSFVRHAADILTLRKWLKSRRQFIPIIAKIEKPRAVDHIAAIAKESNGMMVARGDLGIEMGVEKVPIIQKQLISEANRRRIPIITATQMLESMIQQPRPTRAEASDIANAVLDGTDAVMLSGETAVGKYPIECVRIMSRIILEAEKHIGERQAEHVFARTPHSDNLQLDAITHASRHAARDLHAKAIMVFTVSGKTASILCEFRPDSNIIAFTPSTLISRRLQLFRGVFPVKIRYGKSADAMLREGDLAAMKLGLLKKGDITVILTGKQALPSAQYMAKIHRIGEMRLIPE